MLWAIVSSIFVIYLYRTLNAPAVAETAEGAGPENTIDAALANLNARIDAIEAANKARRTTP